VGVDYVAHEYMIKSTRVNGKSEHLWVFSDSEDELSRLPERSSSIRQTAGCGYHLRACGR
jgi:hypothetical protein